MRTLKKKKNLVMTMEHMGIFAVFTLYSSLFKFVFFKV